jgi:hypothetical protein
LLMLSVESFIVDAKNFAGFITRRLFVRSMFETTNISHGTPDNEEAISLSGYLRLTIQRISCFPSYLLSYF